MTFDKQLIHYQGTCKYILVQTNETAPFQFTIYGRNEKYYGLSVAVLRYVEIELSNITIRFWRYELGHFDRHIAHVSVSYEASPTDIQVNALKLNCFQFLRVCIL